MMVDRAKEETLTFAEFEEKYAGRRYEYVDGRAVPMGEETAGSDGEVTVAPTKLVHGLLVEEISYRMGHYVRQKNLGRVIGAETGFIMQKEPYEMRAADVAFIPAARLKEIADLGDWLPFPPVLAVEVVSESDRAADLRRKIQGYMEHGTRLLWVVYPDDREVEVYTPGADRVTLRAGDALDGGDVLPGFSVALNELFAVLDR